LRWILTGARTVRQAVERLLARLAALRKKEASQQSECNYRTRTASCGPERFWKKDISRY